MTSKRIFYPGYYYTVTADNKIIKCSTDKQECVDVATVEGDSILVCIKPIKTLPKPKMADNITLDFDKELLTIVGSSVKLLDTTYEEGEHTVEIGDNWKDFVKEINKKSKQQTYIGVPPIDGMEVTNEMSDLQ